MGHIHTKFEDSSSKTAACIIYTDRQTNKQTNKQTEISTTTSPHFFVLQKCGDKMLCYKARRGIKLTKPFGISAVSYKDIGHVGNKINTNSYVVGCTW